jgi:chromosomal replication initiator protein
MIFIDRIIRKVSYKTSVPEEKIRNNSQRNREYVEARQIVHYFARKMTQLTYMQIGAIAGGKDHATVLYGCKTVENLIETNPEFANKIKEIKRILR